MFYDFSDSEFQSKDEKFFFCSLITMIVVLIEFGIYKKKIVDKTQEQIEKITILLFIIIIITILTQLIANKAGVSFLTCQIIKFIIFTLGAIELVLDP